MVKVVLDERKEDYFTPEEEYINYLLSEYSDENAVPDFKTSNPDRAKIIKKNCG